jgi:hypothetical protein
MGKGMAETCKGMFEAGKRMKCLRRPKVVKARKGMVRLVQE